MKEEKLYLEDQIGDLVKKYKGFFIGMLLPLIAVFYKIFLWVFLIIVLIFVGYTSWELFQKLQKVLKERK